MNAKPVQSPQVTEQDLEPAAGAKRTIIVIVCAVLSLWEQQTALLTSQGFLLWVWLVEYLHWVSGFSCAITRAVKHLEAEQHTAGLWFTNRVLTRHEEA